MDWDDLRFFAALAEEGSHSAAARSLKVTQPTVGRRIRRLEQELGVHLFERVPEGYVPSTAGTALLRHAQGIGADIQAAQRALRAFQDQAVGVVRVSAPEWVVSRLLAGLVRSMTEAHPGVRVELVAESAPANLPAGGADIAIRARRFDHPGTWQRAVGRADFALYASKEYAKRYGRCMTPRASGHRLLSMDDGGGPIADVEWLRRVAVDAVVVARANGREILCQLACAGCGVACLPRLIGDAEPRLVLLEGLGEAPPRKLWLGVHRDQRALPRIHRVSTVIGEALARALPIKR